MPSNYKDYFIKQSISEHSVVFKWNLNTIPKGVNQILLLADLIRGCQEENKIVEIRPDKRKRAKGLVVIFANTPISE
jgi:hypothetical protein